MKLNLGSVGRWSVKSLKVLALLPLVLLATMMGPRVHHDLIRDYVGSRVVKVTNVEGTSGGTGSHVKTPQGKTYILTNDHVCEIQKDGYVYISGPGIRPIPRRIVERSRNTDLCLIEGVPGVEGLTIAGSELEIGQQIDIVGHPRLMPLTVTSGEINGKMEVDVMDHVMESADDKCDLPKNRQMDVPFMLWMVHVCVIHIPAYTSTVTILPGNSGSPAVDFWGRVIGVAFAGDSEVHWGLLVTLGDVHDFLKPY